MRRAVLPPRRPEDAATDEARQRMDGMDDIIQEFLVESEESLDRVERDLVALEEAHDPELVAGVFRSVHTLKGTCGFLGMSKLEGLAHVGESLLSKVRDGELALTAERTTTLLSMSDAMREILRHVAETGEEGPRDVTALETQLERLQEDGVGASTGGAQPPDGAASERAPDGEAARPTAGGDAEGARSPTNDGAVVELRSARPPAPASDRVPSRPARAGARDAFDPADGATARGAASESVAPRVVRVGVGLLDELMNLVGELVLVRNQILQLAGGVDDAGLAAASQRLDHVTSELQEGVMTTRMQPIGTVWSKLPRVVRDLARACGKEVRIEMHGRETELDRTLIEAIKDPITHLVRNAVDHGIEAPEVREAEGKPREGVLSLRAFHEGGKVEIEIADDGAGIRPAQIERRAVERGLVTSAQAAAMSEREMIQLVFRPGFSTATKVTNVSGRGVGMDVVKTNVERIGGTIDVASRSGEGTTFRVQIPLTLAIVPALVVRCAGERYAIPQISLLELVRLEGAQRRRIESVHGAPVLRLRGRLLPLVDLARLLGVTSDAPADGPVHVVVLHADDQTFGLVVERIHDTEEIVVKPLSRALERLGTYAGATIMGDGRVSLILDVLGLAKRGGVLAERAAASDGAAARDDAGGEPSTQTLLLVEASDGRPLAVPLALVDRLEEIDPATVERAGPHEVVRYREEILPLVHLSRLLFGGAPSPATEPLQVFVVRHGDQRFGLVVDRIHDIVEAPLEVQALGERTGVLGSAIVQDRVVEVLDVEACVGAAMSPRGLESAAGNWTLDWATAAE
ncbi:MAG TPA: chemotaxis protein CheA [Sandaracinaceae bacterium LLY-WYZ-13_1]|nr:chemotaxis protein CheA [Sandaracinaceae bacterium LLY-WYZ-13_1]